MRLKNAPLVHVLAQAVFSRSLNMREHLPALQRRLQGMGFVSFEESAIPEFTLAPGKEPAVTLTPRWDFTDRDLSEGIALSEAWLVLSTSRYRTSEHFLGRLQDCVAAVHEIVRPPLLERVALRYIDLVQPMDGEGFENYVHPGVLGFPVWEAKELVRQLQFLQTVTTFQTDTGTMAVRTMVLPQGQILPPDLLPARLSYEPRFATSRASLTLDFDHFCWMRQDFNPATVMAYATELKKGMTSAFRLITTDFGREKWGPEVSEDT
jgi:uncharacterized protein (TIGR04255 family)